MHSSIDIHGVPSKVLCFSVNSPPRSSVPTQNTIKLSEKKTEKPIKSKKPEKNNRKNRTEKKPIKPIKIVKKPAGSVL